MTNALNKIRTNVESDIDGRSTCIITRKPMNFTYKCTEDNQYIVQIAVKLNNYAEELKQTAVINSAFQELITAEFIVCIIVAIIISVCCILIFSIFMWLRVDTLLAPI